MPIDGELDIVAGLARAGGFTELANPKKVSVNRNGQITQINVREMTEEGERGFLLRPGDIITVAERLF
jgi:protein involved in polysaccharide export with SLBB domain